MSLKSRTVRTRLTLWYLGVLTGILGVYLAGVFLLLVWQMDGVLRKIAAEDLETVKGLLYFEPDGCVGVREDFHHHTYWKEGQERLLEILAPDGTVLYQNERLAGRTLGEAPFRGEGTIDYSERSSRMSDGTKVFLISREYELQDKTILIRVGYPRDLVWGEVKGTLLILLLVSPLVLAATAYAAFRMIGRTLEPVTEMAHRAEQINSEHLSERLPIETQDELGDLARVFNAMLARIEQSFEQLQRFTADASHELRTPLAAIRSIGEVRLQREASPAQYKDTIGSMLEEVSRLTTIVESLLTLSRADAGQIKMQATVFPLMKLVRESAALLEILVEDKHLTLNLIGDENENVQADPLYIRRAVINVLHNAVKFTPAGGSISVRVERVSDTCTELSVKDSGPGVPAEHSEKVFGRFYRMDESRTDGDAGAGLGLAIAKWAVQANKGEIGIRNTDGGTAFWIQLPAATGRSSLTKT